MQIDKYIAELVKLRQAHGPDLQVMTNGGYGPAKKAPLPRIAYMNSLYKQSFFVQHDPDRLRGAKVVRV